MISSEIFEFLTNAPTGHPTAKEVTNLVIASEKILLVIAGFKTVSIKIIVKKIIHVNFMDMNGRVVEASFEKTDGVYRVNARYVATSNEEVTT